MVKYRNFENVLTKTKRKAEYLYYKNLSVLYGQNKSKTWRLVNEIAKRKRKSSISIKSLLDKKGNRLDDPKDIANCLNSHFTSVGKEMADKFDTEDKSVPNPLDYIKKDVKDSMFLNYTSTHEIFQYISKLDNKKSSGFDLINNCILKASNATISSYLKILFNNFFFFFSKIFTSDCRIFAKKKIPPQWRKKHRPNPKTTAKQNQKIQKPKENSNQRKS